MNITSPNVNAVKFGTIYTFAPRNKDYADPIERNVYYNASNAIAAHLNENGIGALAIHNTDQVGLFDCVVTGKDKKELESIQTQIEGFFKEILTKDSARKGLMEQTKRFNTLVFNFFRNDNAIVFNSLGDPKDNTYEASVRGSIELSNSGVEKEIEVLFNDNFKNTLIIEPPTEEQPSKVKIISAEG